MDTRRIASVTGWLWIVTFVTSIPARFILYAPVQDEPNYVIGAGAEVLIDCDEDDAEGHGSRCQSSG